MTRKYKWLFWEREGKMGGDVIGTPRGGYLETTGRGGGEGGEQSREGRPKDVPISHCLSHPKYFIFVLFMCICVLCICVRLYAGACRSRKGVPDSPELELQAVVSHQIWVQETEFGSSARAVGTLRP